jgi:hypothetical protein
MRSKRGSHGPCRSANLLSQIGAVNGASHSGAVERQACLLGKRLVILDRNAFTTIELYMFRRESVYSGLIERGRAVGGRPGLG